MGGIISEAKSVALASRDFKVILQNTTLEFTGSCSISETNERPTGNTAGIDITIRLDNNSYRIHGEDLCSFIEIINDLKPGNNIHFRIRVVSVRNEIKLLEASGRLEKRSAEQNITGDAVPSMDSLFLLTLSDSISASKNADEVLNISCSQLAQRLGIARVYFVEHHEDNQTATIRVECARNDEVRRKGNFPITNDHLNRMLRKRESTVINDTFSSSEIDTNDGFQLAATGVRSLVTVPITRNERVAATLVTSDTIARQWTPLEIHLIKETVKRSWTAAEKLTEEQALRESLKNKTEELKKNHEVLRQSE